MPATTAPAAPPRTMQGIAIPAESVNPALFFQLTRRHLRPEKSINFAGQLQDTVELLKADILAGLDIQFVGTITTVKGAGNVASTGRWPYDLLKRVVLSANGQSNLINVSGTKLKVRDLMKHSDLTDRGVSQAFGAATVNQGTLALASEDWGVGTQVTNIADGAYDVELEWNVPIAEDDVDLLGAIFLATSSSDLTATLQYSQVAEMFTLTGGATATITGKFTVISRKFSVPIGPSGQIVVPDLSTFHSMIESRYAGALGTGENEVRLVGQGAGKNLLRVYGQVWNGSPSNPLPLNATNFGTMAWRYGTNETPDSWPDGSSMRKDQERRYDSDIAGVFGFFCHDFANENVFRDVVDEGTAAELRLVIGLQTGLALTSPALEYVAETVFLSGQAA